VISVFNTFSRGSTHRSLTNTGEGYNLRGAGLPHHTPPPPFPTDGPLLSPNGPARSQVNHSPTKPRSDQTLNLVSGIHPSTSTVIYHLSIALLTVSHQVIGLTRRNRKVNHNATMVPYNSINIMHSQNRTYNKDSK
jgi:hypothetical protein